MSGVMMRAYRVKNIVGAPEWVETERYDIVAKATGRSTADQVNEMLRTMLKERMKLAAHIEPRETSVYVLEVARPNHPGLKKVTLDCDAVQAEREAALKGGRPPATSSMARRSVATHGQDRSTPAVSRCRRSPVCSTS